MRAPLLLIFTLLAGPALAQEDEAPPLGCKEDNSECKEGCTIEYGGSTRTYSQLGTCLQKCKQTYDKCTARHLALQQQKKDGIEPHHGGPEVPPEPGEPKGSAVTTPAAKDEFGDSSPPSESTGRKGVYRASESKKVAEPEPETKPEPKAAEKPVPQEDPADELARAMDPEPAKQPEPAKKGGAKTAAKPEPTAKPEPEKPAPVDPAATTAKPTIDQDVPVPAESKPEPAPKPAPKVQPKPAPAPTKPPPPKRDIDDWDPNEK